jgi:hypothetical protein
LAHRCPPRHYYWRTDTPCANSISAPKPPAPILMADRTQKMDKNVRILNRQGGEIIRCANNMFIYILKPTNESNVLAHFSWHVEGLKMVLSKVHIYLEHHSIINHVTSFTSPIGGPNISVRLAYFHPNRLLTGLYKQETEIR